MIKNNFLKFQIKNCRSGFTLVEVLVATVIFALIITAIGSAFVQSLQIQRRAFLFQRIQENITFATEMIAREARVAVISSPNCLPPQICNSIQMTHPVNGSVAYSLDNGIVNRNGSALTSNDVQFEKFSLYVEGAQAGKQPRITIVISARAADANQTVSIQTQTSVSQRNLNE